MVILNKEVVERLETVEFEGQSNRMDEARYETVVNINKEVNSEDNTEYHVINMEMKVFVSGELHAINGIGVPGVVVEAFNKDFENGFEKTINYLGDLVTIHIDSFELGVIATREYLMDVGITKDDVNNE